MGSVVGQVYIFDADGVAIFPWGFARELQASYDISPETTMPFFTGVFQECLVGKLDLRVALSRYVTKWGWHGTVDELVALWLRADDRPNQVVLNKVSQLRREGFQCCLASNQEAIRADYIAEEMGFSEVFDRLYFSCNLGAMKPDFAFYTAIQSDLGISSGNIYFMDDSQIHVQAAEQVGWKSVLYESESDLEHFMEGTGRAT